MKKLFLCITAIWFVGCAPSKKNYRVRQWWTQRSDGWWILTTDDKFHGMKIEIFECKPE